MLKYNSTILKMLSLFGCIIITAVKVFKISKYFKGFINCMVKKNIVLSGTHTLKVIP